MTCAFVLNGAAGSGCDTDWLARHRDTMRALGAPDRHITLAHDTTALLAAVRRALADGCDRVVAGGGDGTVSAVAGQLVGTPVALGVLPLGTLNHFAKDLGLPLQAEAALQLLQDGPLRRIDVGEVNGAYFLNNASLGLYPRIVQQREEQQRRLGRGKWPAFAWAAWSTLKRWPFLDLRLKADGREWQRRTPFVFVGNNEYRMSGWRIGARERLDSGQLSVYLAHETGRLGLLRLALHALLGRLHQSRDFYALAVEDLRIQAPQALVRVATDGELRWMRPPLVCRIHPRALRVIAPAPAS